MRRIWIAAVLLAVTAIAPGGAAQSPDQSPAQLAAQAGEPAPSVLGGAICRSRPGAAGPASARP